MARKGKSPQLPHPYGANIDLATARMVALSAAKEAQSIGMNAVIAVVDAGGHLVYLERFDRTQFGSVEVAIHKARCSVAFKRPTSLFEEAVNGGKVNSLSIDDVSAVEGGVPLVQRGRIVGAIGVSGGIPWEDGQAARAGAASLK